MTTRTILFSAAAGVFVTVRPTARCRFVLTRRRIVRPRGDGERRYSDGVWPLIAAPLRRNLERGLTS